MTTSQHVHLVVPCRVRFAGVLHTAVAACGVAEGFSVDAIGDLRLLVDEVFTAMRQLGVETVELAVITGGGRLTLALDATAPAGRRRGRADTTFAESVAGAVAVDARFDLGAERPSFAASIAAGGR